jgi:8-oxo-dGTP pyrophosphatase MutT (NUDIX family)
MRRLENPDNEAGRPDPERPGMFIPTDRLPPGFVDRIGRTESVAVPSPAATVVPMRDAAGGPEVLLLKRNRSTGFVPGAWVFPGGRVDAGDAEPSLFEPAPMPAEPPAAYWAAAVRELFEEAGVLLARGPAGEFAPDACSPDLAAWRDALLEDRASLATVLREAALHLALDRMVYIAHWITPVAEPRRYDTRFFLAALPADRTATPDPREMTGALWLSPADALDRFGTGRLPMVFPTVRTLETLAPFASVDDALLAFRDRSIDAILPRLVRSRDGVALVIDDGETNEDRDQTRDRR